ncbi:rhomboid-like protein [Mycobacterium lentiflavum]|nr:rhomboid-like protein [Mycobacterium lentiflavum]
MAVDPNDDHWPPVVSRNHEGATAVLRIENRRTAWSSRVLSVAAWLPVTIGYAAMLLGVSLLFRALGPHVHDVAVREMSTNLHNLAHGQIVTLVGSAFVSDGGHVLLWLPGLVCLLALGELIWRSKGLIIAFALGHIGATLVVAVWLTTALTAGWLPMSLARATDVGMSYGAVCVLGALTASIPSRWRPMWIGWWMGNAVAAALSADFTAVGHVVALLLGITVSFRLRSIVRWTVVHSALLVVGSAFGYMVLCGPAGPAPTAGVAGALIALVAAWILRSRDGAPRAVAGQPGFVPQPAQS